MKDQLGQVTSAPNRETVARFRALFAGLERGHGAYNNINSTREDGKRQGTAITLREPVTDELWAGHLAGKNGIGIIPIRDDSTVCFGAVDVDVYADLNHATIASTIARLQLPLVPCRSKSGGVHIYLFSAPVDAGAMQTKLREIAALLGHGTAEIFPKQDRMGSGANDLGSWINACYFDADKTVRYAVKPNGDAMSVTEFLDAAEAAKAQATVEWITQPLPQNTDALPDGPPCLQHLVTLGFPQGSRNNALFNLCVYAKKANPDGFKADVEAFNQKFMQPPLTSDEVAQLTKSVGGKDYCYKCKEHPLTPHCNAVLCRSRKHGIGTTGKGLIQGLADAITATDSFARDKGECLYHFENGVYKPTGKRFIERQVKALCDEWQRTKDWTPELAAKVEGWLLADAPELWECPPLDTLNCRNGLLEVATGTLRPHSPEHLSAVQIAASFDPAATCPHIDRFVAEVFPDDAPHLTYEVAAWLILPDMNMQKAVLLLGEGSNGKSAWLNLLLALLGRDNVSAISLHRLEADKFAASRLVGKLANICADLPTSELAGTSMFKALTGNDGLVSAERKFEASFEFRPFVRLLFSANSAPRSEDATYGFFRRWLVIPFTRTFDETDPNTIPPEVLKARLSDPSELSGLLNRALAALPTIRKGRFTETASTRAALDEFRETTDPMAVWLDQNTVERSDAIVAKDAVRRAYSQVCQENGRPIMTDVQFTGALKRLRPKVEPSRRTVDGKKVLVFLGLGMVTQDQPPDGLF